MLYLIDRPPHHFSAMSKVSLLRITWCVPRKVFIIISGLTEKVLAWSDVHVVLWKAQSIKGTHTWAVHSTVLASEPITTLDYKEGTTYDIRSADLKVPSLSGPRSELTYGDQDKIGTWYSGTGYGPGESSRDVVC